MSEHNEGQDEHSEGEHSDEGNAPAEAPSQAASDSHEGGESRGDDGAHGDEEHGSHGSLGFYTWVIVALAVVTFIEWQLIPGKMFYFEALHPYLKSILLLLSVGKFFGVVFFFMHLAFDRPIFKRLFISVLGLAICCVFAVIAVLGSLPGDNPEWNRINAGIRPVPEGAVDPNAPKAKKARSGEDLYAMVCVACHQADGSGKVGSAVLGADFNDAALWAKGDAKLLNSITKGAVGSIGTMPAQKGALSEAEITAVFAYVKGRFAPKP
jgi:cytochrome c oxidase subunit IV